MRGGDADLRRLGDLSEVGWFTLLRGVGFRSHQVCEYIYQQKRKGRKNNMFPEAETSTGCYMSHLRASVAH